MGVSDWYDLGHVLDKTPRAPSCPDARGVLATSCAKSAIQRRFKLDQHYFVRSIVMSTKPSTPLKKSPSPVHADLWAEAMVTPGSSLNSSGQNTKQLRSLLFPFAFQFSTVVVSTPSACRTSVNFPTNWLKLSRTAPSFAFLALVTPTRASLNSAS